MTCCGFRQGMLVMGVVIATTSIGYAGTMDSKHIASGNAYVSVFGGAGTSNNVSVRQFGTNYYIEAVGGSMAINAFGSAQSGTVPIVGGNAGYQWSQIAFTSSSILSGISPATELEGYYIGKATLTGHAVDNGIIRPDLSEHNFLVTYPITTSVFLINAIANLDLAGHPNWHPYVGAGFGAGMFSITNAVSTQLDPNLADIGVNHYNSNPNSSASTFAGQVKAGLSIDISDHFSVFGEYRWLSLASSNYIFGSTVYVDHAATSSWLVNLGTQIYNYGSAGIRYRL